MGFKWLAWKNYKKKIIKIVNRFKKIIKFSSEINPNTSQDSLSNISYHEA